ncbi:FecR family protein [Novosphingobium sp. ST904]|nr:FecR family protein [Novosphingobium sp. ST904]
MMTNVPETTITPEMRQEAARLFGDHVAGVMSAADEARLAQWLAEDPRHARAFAAVERTWRAIDETTMPPVPVRGTAPWSRRFARWRPAGTQHGVSAPVHKASGWARGLVAASVLLLIATQSADIALRLRADAITNTGERRSFALPDGSIALLNTDSAVAVDFADGRHIRLLRGEAAFTVAPDPARPFVVEAGGGTVTALGTRFLVRLDGDETRVAVTEHSVRIDLNAVSRLVREGEEAGYGRDRISPLAGQSVHDTDGWTRGVIRVVNRPLADVVREIGRYRSGYILVLGDGLSQRRVNGVFRLDDPDRSIDAIGRSLGIRSTRIGGMVTILHD